LTFPQETAIEKQAFMIFRGMGDFPHVFRGMGDFPHVFSLLLSLSLTPMPLTLFAKGELQSRSLQRRRGYGSSRTEIYALNYSIYYHVRDNQSTKKDASVYLFLYREYK
jgi:hypothetical protein